MHQNEIGPPGLDSGLVRCMLVMVVDVDVVVVVVGESPGGEKSKTYVPAIIKNPMVKAATLRDSHRGSDEFQVHQTNQTTSTAKTIF